MKFIGEAYIGDSGDFRFRKPLFSPHLKIAVFDYDDLLMLHKRGYKNGCKANFVRHRYRELHSLCYIYFAVLYLYNCDEKGYK